jgi:RNA recognition motif-containing protein
MKLIVRNLARTTTEAALRAMFEVHGAVQSCTLVMDKETGSSKGFGFVEMPKQGDAKAAVKVLNGKDVDGNKIRVKKAGPKPDTGKSPSTEAENGD